MDMLPLPDKRICTNVGFPETQAIAEAAASIREEDNEREEEDEAERSWWDSPAESQPDAANRCGAWSVYGLCGRRPPFVAVQMDMAGHRRDVA